jgi:hypothetical protein
MTIRSARGDTTFNNKVRSIEDDPVLFDLVSGLGKHVFGEVHLLQVAEIKE